MTDDDAGLFIFEQPLIQKQYNLRNVTLHGLWLHSIFNGTNINYGQSYPNFGSWKNSNHRHLILK